VTHSSLDTTYDYAGKYTAQGWIGRCLVDRFYRGMAELLDLCRPGSCLEVGCGEGFSTERLHALLRPGTPFHGLDVESRLVGAARSRNPGIPLWLGSAYALAARDGAYEAVVALEVLEHLEHPGAALRELGRVSARWLLLSVPREPIWRALNLLRLRYAGALGNTPGHVHHWSRRSFLRLAGSAGRIRAVRSPLPWTQVLLESH